MSSSFNVDDVKPCSAAFCERADPSYAMYESLKDVCHNNVEFFKSDDTETGQRLHGGFLSMKTHVDVAKPLVDHVRKIVHLYDFDENTPGNGYRSFVSVVDSCIMHSVKLGRQVCIARDSLIFRKAFYMKEVEAYSQLLASICSCLQILHQFLSWSESGDLFIGEDKKPENWLEMANTINQYSFYGRCIGFQFVPSMRGILRGIAIVMAGFSEAYYSRKHVINSFWASGKFMMDPEQRARRIANISKYADIDFCKTFWFLSESHMMQKISTLSTHTCAVNKLISIPPEPIEFNKVNGSEIVIQVPEIYIGQRPLQVRLISKVKRRGMDGERGCKPPARGLIFHCHGGGFISQTSSSHEIYLKEWAALLDVPIVSVDYSLAPQAPFPRACQEVFYAYCWVLKNAALLGSTAERVILAGDSAGANLNTGLCLRTIEEGVRSPDGIFSCYAPMLIDFSLSPSRLLTFMDPLLTSGFMMRCSKAYACPPEKTDKVDDNKRFTLNGSILSEKDLLKLSPSQDGQGGIIGISDTSSFEEVSESDLVELQAHKSLTSDHLSDTLSGASLSSDHKTLVTPTNDDRSQQCISDFLDKYALESDTDSEGQKIPVLKKKSLETTTGTVTPESATLTDGSKSVTNRIYESSSSKSIHTRLTTAAGNIMGTVSSKLSNLATTSRKSTESIHSDPDTFLGQTPLESFDKLTIPKDQYLSPYLASDDALKCFPPTKLMTVHLDPCLDDCVMFAKKIRKLGVTVTLDILEGLPHGFLNFGKACKEAHDGVLLCVVRMRELLDLESLPGSKEGSPKKSGA